MKYPKSVKIKMSESSKNFTNQIDKESSLTDQGYKIIEATYQAGFLRALSVIKEEGLLKYHDKN